jgi:hypothetical protein
MITLLTEPSKITRRDPRLLLLYGQQKLGKSTWLSELPGRYMVISTDPRGWEYISGYYVQVNNILEYCQAAKLIKEATPRYDFVGVDTIDLIDDWSKEEATRLYKMSPIGKSFQGTSIVNELPKGGGYPLYWEVFTKVLSSLLGLADQVIIIGHIRDKLIGQINGQTEVFAKDLALTGKVCSMLTSTVDTTGYITRTPTSILCNFQTHELITNGSRCPHLKGKNFEMKGSKFDWSVIFPDWYERNKKV